MGIKERYLKLKNRQAKDWWTATFGDPFSWWILALIADLKWITPNRITILSFLAKIYPAYLFINGDRTLVLWGVLILQIGQILDSMDGNLARYRGISTLVGSFLDKILDGFGFLIVMTGVSWYAYSNGSPSYSLILGPLSGGFYLVICYIYWVIAWMEVKNFGQGQQIRPGSNEKSIQHIPVWKYMLNKQAKILSFKQADFYFWIGLFMVINKPLILLWLLSIVLGRRVVSRIIRRSQYLRTLDAKQKSD